MPRHFGKSGTRKRRRDVKKGPPRRRARPPFLAAKCDPGVQSETAQHLSILRECFDLAKLGGDHPIVQAWQSATSRARFDLHHLADDLIAVREVSGFQGLLKSLTQDLEAYEDYRYELRIAASLARAAGQRVVKLAGKAAGPDVEFICQSGQRCGIACYRARHASQALKDIGVVCEQLSRTFAGVFSQVRVPVDVGIEIVFPVCPVAEAHITAAERLIVNMWRCTDEPCHSDSSGVAVDRCVVLTTFRPPSVRRRARLRFLFPTPPSERARVDRHIAQKAEKEERAWGRAFDGYPILSVEQSPFASDVDALGLAEVVAKSTKAFKGCFSTRMQHPVTKGIVHGLEDVKVTVPGLRLGFCTYAQNSEAWADGAPVIEYTGDHACEFWDVWEQSSIVFARQSKPLNVDRRATRLDAKVASFAKLNARPDLIKQLAQAALRHRESASEVFDW